MTATTETTQGTALTTPQMITIGLSHHQSGRLAEAKQSYLEVLNVEPENFDALHLLGVLAHQVGNHELAVDLIEKAVAQHSESAVAFNNLGEAYKAMKRLGEAERCYRTALQLKPDFVEVCSNLGNALKGLGRLEEAAEIYRQGLQVNPEFVLIHYSLGATLRELGQLPEAEASLRQALALKPDFADAGRDLALLQLLQGDYRQGASYFAEKGLESEGLSATRKEWLAQLRGVPSWQGEPLEGRRLLLVTGQGAGDNLMMLRYLPQIKELQPGRLLGYSLPHLARILLNTGSFDQVIPMTAQPPWGEFDLYCPMMRLPHLFGTTVDSIPATVPYLRSAEGDGRWQEKLNEMEGFKVGLCWAGGSLHGNHARRSVPLQLFSPLLEVANIRLVSLQKGKEAGQLQGAGIQIFDCMDDCRDFADTAGLIEQLDLVISVDTAVAHLAGALGKPVWLLNSLESEWRWMLERSDSPWYPTMRIFRQTERGQWDGVIEELSQQLALFAALSS